MSGRRRQGLSPSLFPFLAVLVCTLGTLILLLALVAQNATDTAEESARAQQQASSNREDTESTRPRITRASAEALLRDEEFRVQELVSIRDEQTAELETKRDELTHLDDHIERLRQQLQRLNQEVQLATGQSDLPKISDDELLVIQAKLESEQAALEQLRKESSDPTPRVVIVPHKGPNGTDRRPVYLECTQEGVTIWPEGSKITQEQLVNTSYSANPLDAALRTIRMHAMQNYGDSVPPYPLLVVRPDGIETYGAARRAMQDWDDQFGYELVPGDVKLAFSQPDPNLKRRMEVAINTAVAEQQVRVAMSNRLHASRGTLPTGSSSTQSGGSRLPTLSAAALDRAGRAAGFGRLPDDHRSNNPTTSSYARGPEIGSVTRNNPVGSLSEVDDAGAAARRMAEQMQSAATEMRSGDSLAGTDGSGNPATKRSPSYTSPTGRQFAELGTDGSNRTNPLTGLAESTNEDVGGPFDASRSQAASSSNFDGSSDSPGDSGETAPINQPMNGRETSRGADGDPAAPDSSVASSQIASNQPNAAAGNPQSFSPPASSAVSGSSAMQGSPVSMMDEELSADPRMAAQIPRSLQASLTPQSELVQRQGRDWALPESMAGLRGNAIVRTIRMQCYHDRFVLLPSKSEGATEVFSFFNGDVDRATLELATALRDRIDKWGPALPGGRWQPRLEVEITPNSQMRFHQLRTLMNGSGIELIGREAQ